MAGLFGDLFGKKPTVEREYHFDKSLVQVLVQLSLFCLDSANVRYCRVLCYHRVLSKIKKIG
jgi:hypothetical protein